MFCAIPMPYRKWDDEARPLMTLMLPFVGLEIGLLWMSLAYLFAAIPTPRMLAAALMCVFPHILSGYMHLDGFMDVTDAIRSCRDVQDRRRILKDPHTGSFAVVGVVVLLLLTFAFFASGNPEADFKALVYIPVISRICSAFFVTVLPPMSTSQFSGNYREGIKKGHIIYLAVMFIAVTLSASVFCGTYALVCPAVLVGYLIALVHSYKSLEGMNGDIAGYSLVIGEFCGIAAFTLL